MQHRAGRDPNVGVVGPHVRRDETDPEREGPRRCVPQGGDGEVLRLAARERPRRREGIRRAIGTGDPEGDLVLDGKLEGGRGQQEGRGTDNRDEEGGDDALLARRIVREVEEPFGVGDGRGPGPAAGPPHEERDDGDGQPDRDDCELGDRDVGDRDRERRHGREDDRQPHGEGQDFRGRHGEAVSRDQGEGAIAHREEGGDRHDGPDRARRRDHGEDRVQCEDRDRQADVGEGRPARARLFGRQHRGRPGIETGGHSKTLARTS